MTPNNRLGTLSAMTLRTMVTDRDLEILRLLRAHRFLTTRQIQRLSFWGHATASAAIRSCVRVLTRLEGRALIFKLNRQIGGIHAGSGSYVWGLDDAGDRLMRADASVSNGKRQRTFDPSQMFLAHTLAIAEARVMLEEAARENLIELIEVTTEPKNWRTFPGKSLTVQILKPDLHAITATGEFEDHWFIEIDNGTESLPTVLNKCVVYQQYYETGREQSAAGVFPKVVWVMSDSRRRTRLTEAIDADRRLAERLFCAIGPDHFVDLVAGKVTPVSGRVKTIPQHQTSGLLGATELSSGGHLESEPLATPILASKGREVTP